MSSDESESKEQFHSDDSDFEYNEDSIAPVMGIDADNSSNEEEDEFGGGWGKNRKTYYHEEISQKERAKLLRKKGKAPKNQLEGLSHEVRQRERMEAEEKEAKRLLQVRANILSDSDFLGTTSLSQPKEKSSELSEVPKNKTRKLTDKDQEITSLIEQLKLITQMLNDNPEESVHDSESKAIALELFKLKRSICIHAGVLLTHRLHSHSHKQTEQMTSQNTNAAVQLVHAIDRLNQIREIEANFLKRTSLLEFSQSDSELSEENENLSDFDENNEKLSGSDEDNLSYSESNEDIPSKETKKNVHWKDEIVEQSDSPNVSESELIIERLKEDEKHRLRSKKNEKTIKKSKFEALSELVDDLQSMDSIPTELPLNEAGNLSSKRKRSADSDVELRDLYQMSANLKKNKKTELQSHSNAGHELTEEQQFYEMVKKKSQPKVEQHKSKKQKNPQKQTQQQEDEADIQGTEKRKATDLIVKNKGTVKHKKRSVPRSRLRVRYETALKRRVGAHAPMREKRSVYPGEKSIKSGIVRSRKL